jgi:hypothetical protein
LKDYNQDWLILWKNRLTRKDIHISASLCGMHPTVKSLQRRLANAFISAGEHDKAMAFWWALWKENLARFSFLQQFRASCNRRIDPCVRSSSTMGLPYFLLVCVLHLLSDMFMLWGIEEVDWWPLTTEDDYMKLSPYMVKRKWRCVQFPVQEGFLQIESDRFTWFRLDI